MVPELLGFLIIAGALLVLVVRYLSQRQKGVDMEELRVSTDQLKAELTRSADAVISRMGKHIQHLENLLRQADERNVRLEAAINEYKRLAEEMEDRSAKLNRELGEARKVIAELSAYHTVPIMSSPATMQPVSPAPVMQRIDDRNFASVLQNSMERAENTEDSAVPNEEPAINAQQAAGLAEAMNRSPEDMVEAAEEEKRREEPSKREEKTISPNAAKAKALLRSGYSVEETARETGIGRGAIELLREMNRHDLEER